MSADDLVIRVMSDYEEQGIKIPMEWLTDVLAVYGLTDKSKEIRVRNIKKSLNEKPFDQIENPNKHEFLSLVVLSQIDMVDGNAEEFGKKLTIAQQWMSTKI